MPWDSRPQHSFISGRSGSGKTTLLMRLMGEHIREGVPFIFIDFHGQATDDLLALVGASSSKKRFVLLEPWGDRIIGWNPLETASQSRYPVVQELVAVFHRRLWPDAWGPRLEELLRMTLLALAENSLTLVEATSFLSRADFRRSVLRQVKIPEVREFWSLRFERLSPSQRSLVTETVLNKLSTFHDPALKYVIGQAKGTLDLDTALRDGSTVLANLSGGSLSGTNFLLAALLVAKLKAAVYRRSRDARPFAVFLDEFQEMIALEALDDYLRSFRKFGCSVYLATQQLDLPTALKSAIFTNCSRFFAFATSAADAAFLGKEFGGSEGALVADLLPDLRTGQACVKFRGEPACLLHVTPPGSQPDPKQVVAGRARCLNLGLSRGEIEAEIVARQGRFTGHPVMHEPLVNAPDGPHDLADGYDSF